MLLQKTPIDVTVSISKLQYRSHYHCQLRSPEEMTSATETNEFSQAGFLLGTSESNNSWFSLPLQGPTVCLVVRATLTTKRGVARLAPRSNTTKRELGHRCGGNRSNIRPEQWVQWDADLAPRASGTIWSHRWAHTAIARVGSDASGQGCSSVDGRDGQNVAP